MPKLNKRDRRNTFITCTLASRAQQYAGAFVKASGIKADDPNLSTILRLVAQAYVNGVNDALCVEDGVERDLTVIPSV